LELDLARLGVGLGARLEGLLKLGLELDLELDLELGFNDLKLSMAWAWSMDRGAWNWASSLELGFNGLQWAST
jgi:hypothetical protein